MRDVRTEFCVINGKLCRVQGGYTPLLLFGASSQQYPLRGPGLVHACAVCCLVVAGWCNRTILSKESVEPMFHSQPTVAFRTRSRLRLLLVLQSLVGRHPVDLVFVVGCTASMGQWIGMLTSAIHPLAAALRARFGDTEIRFGFVDRDYAAKQDHKRFEIAELTDHFDALRAFLSWFSRYLRLTTTDLTTSRVRKSTRSCTGRVYASCTCAE